MIDSKHDKKSLVVVDLDGTLIDFKRIDNIIISRMFGKNRFVRILDKILWKINDLDYISNCYGIFKFRTEIYSFFSSYTKEEVMKMYGNLYVSLAKEDTITGYRYIKSLEKFGYEVIIVTHNVFADGLNKYVPVTFSFNKKKYFEEKLLKSYNIIYVVGNNYTDDIKSAYLVKAFPVYVGKSNIVRKLIKKRGKAVRSISAAISFIKGHNVDKNTNI